mmetsp:Transcript_58998/g.140878  ORF Transcript_58998/g.140878 Transcript_58998/m.140878 type:complete len:517 (+) Transcript_58998:77-1627(+)
MGVRDGFGSWLLLPLCVAATERLPACGCSWSSRGGCGISSQQLLSGLMRSRVDTLCTATGGKGDLEKTDSEVRNDDLQMKRAAKATTKECELQQRVASYAQKASEVCMKLDAAKCYEEKICEWGAQQVGACGMDEEQFIIGLVGEENHKHPLVRSVINSNTCREYGEQSCEAHSNCRWSRGTQSCDAQPEQFWTDLVAQPKILRMLTIFRDSSDCHAIFEETGVCAQRDLGRPDSWCRLELGVCTKNYSYVTDYDVDTPKAMSRMMSTICMEMGRRGQFGCKEPCVAAKDAHHYGHGRWCQAPTPLPAHFIESLSEDSFDDSDWTILLLMIQLQSAMTVRTARCSLHGSDESICQQYSEMCKASADHGDSAEGEPAMLPVSNSTAAGTTGTLLSEFVAAASNGHLTDKLTSYLQENPDALERIGEGFAESYSKVASPRRGSAETEQVMPTSTSLSTFVSVTASLLIIMVLLAGTAVCFRWAVVTMSLRSERARLLQPEETMEEYEPGPVRVAGSAC